MMVLLFSHYALPLLSVELFEAVFLFSLALLFIGPGDWLG